jgi:S1-C subfamily serine protease
MQGSGVLLPSGKIATNSHVVKGGASYQVSQGKRLALATLYAENAGKDICLLNVEGIKGKPAQLGNTTSLKVGDKVYAVGAPMGLDLSLSDGIVAQLRGGPPPLIQITAAISPGSSGGGLFDSEGRLIGLTTLYVGGGQNLNFAIPVEWMSEIKPGLKPIADDRSQTFLLICKYSHTIEADGRISKSSGENLVTVNYTDDGDATIKKQDLGAEFLGKISDEEIYGETTYKISELTLYQTLRINRYTGAFEVTYKTMGSEGGLIHCGICEPITKKKF